MSNFKIKYGIDLGTTNSALARLVSGKPKIVKTDMQKDTLPSCVGFNKKGSSQVGEPAFSARRSQILNALKTGSDDLNVFSEFKRTMGTDKRYSSSFMKQDFSSEELSAEVLRKFRSLLIDEDLHSAVITVPAQFTVNQKDATVRAAAIAGFEHCELLQEPIAASLAYGLSTSGNDGYWLVFDLGGGTFDAALMHVSDGIIKVADTDGDNFLGGKNIDLAIAEEILIPHLAGEYSIDSILDDPRRQMHLRNAMKEYAEPAKIQLSFNDSSDIESDIGDFPEDDDGIEVELDLTLTRELLKPVETPIFQKAIDICKALLKRNGLKGKNLTTVILVGGPTYSPNLRELLREHITEKIDTTVDPMTAVAKGAALYAATLDLPKALRTAKADSSRIALDVKYESTTVEASEFVTIKLADVQGSPVPKIVVVEIERRDGGWSSGRFELNPLGEAVEVQMGLGRANVFVINLYGETGDRIQCEPNEFTILQGTKITSSTLSHSFGVGVKDADTGKVVFRELKGLEKNRSYPSIGVSEGLFTQKQISPAAVENEIIIPLYQGEHDASGQRAIYSEHVYDAVISGDELSGVLPANSPVELTVELRSDQEIMMRAFFPSLEDTIEIPVPTGNTQTANDADWLWNEIHRAERSLEILEELGEHINPAEIEKLASDVERISKLLEQAPDDYDRRMEVRNNLRKAFREIDSIESKAEWPAVEARLNDTAVRIRTYFESISDDLEEGVRQRAEKEIKQIENRRFAIVAEKDIKSANQLIEEIDALGFALSDATLGVSLYIGILREYDRDFDIHDWSDRNKARLLVNQGLVMAANRPTKDGILSLLRELIRLLPDSDKLKLECDERLLSGR